jgi:hypothetical protein
MAAGTVSVLEITGLGTPGPIIQFLPADVFATL